MQHHGPNSLFSAHVLNTWEEQINNYYLYFVPFNLCIQDRPATYIINKRENNFLSLYLHIHSTDYINLTVAHPYVKYKIDKPQH